MLLLQWFFGIQIKLAQSSTWLSNFANALAYWSWVLLRISSNINAFFLESVFLLIKLLFDLAYFSFSCSFFERIFIAIVLSNNVSFFVKLSNWVLSISWYPWVGWLVINKLGSFLLQNSFGLCKLLPLCHDCLCGSWFESWKKNLWFGKYDYIRINIIVYILVF